MGEYRELVIKVKRRFVHLVGGGLATIGTAVAAAGLVVAIDAPEALAEQPRMTQKGKVVKSPVEWRAAGDGDFANAIPMALPESTLRPASQAEAMLRAPARSSAEPRSRAGDAGTGDRVW